MGALWETRHVYTTIHYPPSVVLDYGRHSACGLFELMGALQSMSFERSPAHSLRHTAPESDPGFQKLQHH